VLRSLPDGYELDDDVARIDVAAVTDFLTTSAYWGRWRVGTDIATQVTRSWLVIGVYARTGAQVGFARVVSDGVAFAYLADVYVLEQHRGRGLGQALVAFTIEQGPTWRWLLHTQDAYGLYAQYGFGPAAANLMERPAPTG
jgi:GNAT superfamily N-acetyltransferase